MIYDYQENLIKKDRAIILGSRGVGLTTTFIRKILSDIKENNNKRIVIITPHDHATYATIHYAIHETFDQSVISHKTQNAIKVNDNWIHILKPSTFQNVRGYRITDLYVQDFDEFSDNQKEELLLILPIYSPKIFWLWGNTLSDKHSKSFIKLSYKNYLLGNDLGMEFVSILSNDTTKEEIENNSIKELQRRL